MTLPNELRMHEAGIILIAIRACLMGGNEHAHLWDKKRGIGSCSHAQRMVIDA